MRIKLIPINHKPPRNNSIGFRAGQIYDDEFASLLALSDRYDPDESSDGDKAIERTPDGAHAGAELDDTKRELISIIIDSFSAVQKSSDRIIEESDRLLNEYGTLIKELRSNCETQGDNLKLLGIRLHTLIGMLETEHVDIQPKECANRNIYQTLQDACTKCVDGIEKSLLIGIDSESADKNFMDTRRIVRALIKKERFALLTDLEEFSQSVIYDSKSERAKLVANRISNTLLIARNAFFNTMSAIQCDDRQTLCRIRYNHEVIELMRNLAQDKAYDELIEVFDYMLEVM